MGLTKNMIQLLLSSKERRSVSFDEMVMIGRQNLHLNTIQLAETLSFFQYDATKAEGILTKNNTFSEGFFELIGANKIDSIDASDYEQATIIHDFNNPISPNHKGKYSLVLDSGTLEHVFNFPVAIKNCMELTKVGGHFIGIYPANNFFGHGFYQFSSELFYRVLSKENGFKIEDVLLFVDEKSTSYYSVQDTDEVHQRISFTNQKPVYLYVVAKKIDAVEIFSENPFQMDYAEIKWQGKRKKLKIVKKRKSLISYFPPYVRNLLKAIINKKPLDDNHNFNKPFFKTYKLK